MSNPIARMNGGFPLVGRLALSAIAAVAVTTQAVEFENEADVVRATRLVELKARESVEDFSGHAHQTGTFY